MRRLHRTEVHRQKPSTSICRIESVAVYSSGHFSRSSSMAGRFSPLSQLRKLMGRIISHSRPALGEEEIHAVRRVIMSGQLIGHELSGSFAQRLGKLFSPT